MDMYIHVLSIQLFDDAAFSFIHAISEYIQKYLHCFKLFLKLLLLLVDYHQLVIQNCVLLFEFLIAGEIMFERIFRLGILLTDLRNRGDGDEYGPHWRGVDRGGIRHLLVNIIVWTVVVGRVGYR